MSNLLPLPAKQRIVHEYWIRVISVWLFLVTFALVIVAALMAPTYFLISSQLQVIGNEYADAESTEASFAETNATIEEANALAQMLNVTEQDPSFSDLIAELEQVTATGVTLTNITLTKSGAELPNISIVGVADTRASLANLKDAILSSKYFSDAKIPLSNFAKEKDIDFSITIKPASQTP